MPAKRIRYVERQLRVIHLDLVDVVDVYRIPAACAVLSERKPSTIVVRLHHHLVFSLEIVTNPICGIPTSISMHPACVIGPRVVAFADNAESISLIDCPARLRTPPIRRRFDDGLEP